MNYSCVQGTWTGAGGMSNIDLDPTFVLNPDPGPDGMWDGVDDDYGDLHLLAASPCINMGDNSALPADAADLDGDGDIAEPIPFDLDGNPRILETTVDAGAFEFVRDSDGDGLPDYLDACPAEDATGLDANGDGCIDRIEDLAAVIEALGLPDGLENALVAKVENARAALARGNANAAAGQLGAFINHVEAQRSKKIAHADAEMLIAYAENLMAQLP